MKKLLYKIQNLRAKRQMLRTQHHVANTKCQASLPARGGMGWGRSPLWALVSCLFLLSLSSCVNDSIESCPNDPNSTNKNSDPGFFLAVNIHFPSEIGSRSFTNENGGTEDLDAIANENKVESLHLYFFDGENDDMSDNNLLCEFSSQLAEGDKLDITPKTSDGEYSLIQRVDIEDLKKIFSKQKVNVYALANLATYPSVSTTGTITNEADFLETYFSVSQDQLNAESSYLRPFSTITNGETSYGMVCPMANEAKFTIDLSSHSFNIDENSSIGEVVAATEALFTGTFSDTYNGVSGQTGKKWAINDGDHLSLERMVARVDYKDGSNTSINSRKVNNLYKLSDHSTSISECDINGGGVYLKVNTLSIKNIGGMAYHFRHTAPSGADRSTAGSVISPFGVERGDVASVYNWIADKDWSSKVLLTPQTGSNAIKTADEITSYNNSNYTNNGYSPWFYLLENTVKSVSDMSDSKCTNIEFEVVLYKNDGTIYKTNSPNTNLRITCNKSGADQGKYKVLTPVKDSDNKYYYSLTYKYLIPHNVKDSGSNVDGADGKESSLNPMHYAIVRNNVYQLSLSKINGLPAPNQPDNFVLMVEIAVLSWTQRDIEVDF